MSRHDSIARKPRHATALLVLSAVLLLAGAAVAEKKQKDGDGIADAAKETAKPVSEQHVVHSDKKDDDHDGGSGVAAVSFTSCNRHERRHEEEDSGFHEKIHITSMVAMSAPSNANFAPSAMLGLRAGIGDPRRTSLDLAVMGGAAHFTPGSDMATLLRRPYELAIETTLRHSLTPESAGFSIAPLVGFRAGLLTWDYLNGILLEQNGEVRHETSDWIPHYSPLVGVALAFPVASHLEIGGALVAGWRFYGAHSDLGLRNDLFADGRFTELRLETRFTF